MGEEKLSINISEVEAHIQNLIYEMNMHSTYQCKPFEDDLICLEYMNTDFVAQLKTMLGDLNDNDGKLAKKYVDIVDTTNQILKKFAEIDEETYVDIGTVGEG